MAAAAPLRLPKNLVDCLDIYYYLHHCMRYSVAACGMPEALIWTCLNRCLIFNHEVEDITPCTNNLNHMNMERAHVMYRFLLMCPLRDVLMARNLVEFSCEGTL